MDSEFYFYHKKSFTLIELLVVIAIIGLLASIVVVNVNSARDKAQIAKNIQFSSSIYNSLGSEALGFWDFNALAGGQVKDISGNGNNGVVTGATPAASLTFSGGNLGNALSFDGIDDNVQINLFLPTQTYYKVTMSAWIKPYQSNSRAIIGRAHCDEIILDGGTITYYSKYQDATYDSINGSGIKLNEWNFIAAGVDQNTGKIFLSVNGTYLAISTGSGNINKKLFTGTSYIGKEPTACFNPNLFNGLIDEVGIYSAALTSAEIQKLYAEGLPRYLIAKQ